MTPSQLERQINALNQRNGPHSPSGVSQFIRNAERLMAEEKFESAMDQLIVAQQLDPENQYIRAIMERLVTLQTSKTGRPMQRGLQVTVGKTVPAAIEPTPHDLPTVVKELTAAAERLRQQGQFETAFNTLMKAYLLDPVSPYVLSAEKTILPAWNLLHKRNAKVEPITSVAAPLTAAQETPTVQIDADRLQQLKDVKAKERKEKEDALWREASSMPRMYSGEKTQEPDMGENEPMDGEGIISRLRKKKLLP